MDTPTEITVLETRFRVRAWVKPTEPPTIWELQWRGTPGPRTSYRMLHTAEAAVLRNEGETLLINCPQDQEAVREQLDKWPKSIMSNTGDAYRLELIHVAEDGLVHDDFDFRTPLRRITCPTCVERIAESRARARDYAFGEEGNGPREIAKHTRAVAEAYNRLAEIEETLNLEDLKKTRGS